MKELAIFQGFGFLIGKDLYATRGQIRKMYDVPRRTLSDNIKKLQEDGLINEIIAIGFRLRSDKAIKLQRHAADLAAKELLAMVQEKRMLELELSYAWNRSDTKDLYR